MRTAKMISGKCILLACLIFDLWLSSISADGHGDSPSPTVNTKYGKLKGKRLRVKGIDQAVDGYFGIPFAKPPTGPLRFSPPKPVEPWKGVKDATAYPPMCVQNVKFLADLERLAKNGMPVLTDSEDCLYLNIYAPENLDKKAGLPVMVWIHGGGLVMGGASMYDGSALSAYENVVVVAIQYRLGILGFFSTGDEHARGNWGLLDQVAALQWIQENIANFGGDPDSVTIFGESAGGFSVSALILSPLTKGLVHQAISESGVALLPAIISIDTDTTTYVKNTIANLSNCETRSSVAMIECLRKRTEEEILKATNELNYPYVPAVVDGIFLPKSPEELLAKLEFHPVPYMIGVNNDEFGWVLSAGLMNISNFEEGMDKEVAIKNIDIFPTGLPHEHNLILLDEYIGDTTDPQQIRNGFVEALADALFVVPAVKTAKLYRESGHPVYMYEFQHRASVYDDIRPKFVKADHGDEIGFVLGGPFLMNEVKIIEEATDEEKQLSRTLMKYWANFARNGNPNGNDLPKWLAYDRNEHYLEINLQQEMRKQLKDDRIKFWTEILPKRIDAMTEEKKEHTEL
ncbi:cocaine esterase-like [Pleurodeles waltl]|uniref:cocaine esterase-like n=1 Tax=Pleurodeles waltl TaxID=8319 RepID=UPI003709C3A3